MASKELEDVIEKLRQMRESIRQAGSEIAAKQLEQQIRELEEVEEGEESEE